MPSPERVKAAKSRVAVVYVVSGGILLTLIFLLAGSSWFRRQATAYLYVPDATGLGIGAPVRADGIGIGKVAGVALSGSRQPNREIKVTLQLDAAMLRGIPADSTAQIGAETMVGDRYVDISTGRSPARLKSHGEIAYRPDTDLMRSLDLSQFEQSIRQVEGLLDDIEAGRGRVGVFIQTEGVYADMRKRVTEAEHGLREAMDQTTSVGQALFTDRLYRDLEATLGTLDAGLAKLQAGQGDGGKLLRDSAQYDQLLASARQTRKAVEDLRTSEFMRSEDAYSSFLRSLGDLTRSVDQFNSGPLMTSSALYDNLNGSAKEMSEFLKDFRVNPRKYLRMKVF